MSILQKKHFLIILCLFSIFTVNAQFTVNKTSGCAPLTDVNFTSPLPGDWDFDNGASAVGDNVTATYVNPGDYFVTYTRNGVIEYRDTITVFGNPDPDFSAPITEGCVPLEVDFEDLSQGTGGSSITNWQWAFGDGGTDNAQDPSYDYTINGSYDVSLTVTDDNGCSASTTKDDFVVTSNPPIVSFTTTPSPAISCSAPLTVSLNNSSTSAGGSTNNLEYEWDFGNGETSIVRDPADVTYNTEGNYIIELTVTANQTCQSTNTVNVNVGGPLAVINVPDTVCLNTTYSLSNGSIDANSYRWTVGGSTYNSFSPNHNFNQAGLDTIQLIAISNLGCSDTTTKEVYVEEIFADFDMDQTYDCQRPFCFQFNNTSSGNASNFSWDFGNGAISNEENPEYCYLYTDNEYYVFENTIYEVELTVTSSNGCSADFFQNDTIYPITAFFFPDVARGCAPLTVNFSDSTRSRENVVSWSYDFDDGNTSNAQNPVHTFTDTGTYAVTLIAENAFGCVDTSYEVIIEVGEDVALDFNFSPATACVGDTFNFNDLTADYDLDYYHFEVEGNKTASCPSESSQSYIPFNDFGPKDVTFYGSFNGCISDTTITDAIDVTGSYGQFYYKGDCSTPLTYDFIANIEGATEWEWDFGDGTAPVVTTTEDSVQHTYAATGDYSVTLTTKNPLSGCSDRTYNVLVRVREIQADLSIDSIFCANQDYLFETPGSQDVDSTCNYGFRWDLGPQTPPTMTSVPENVYNFPDTGDYEVRLIVKDVNGCLDTASQMVKVGDIFAQISADKVTGCMPLTINFVDSTQSDTTLTNWEWSVGTTLFGANLFSDADTAQITLTDVSEPTTTIFLSVQDSLGCTGNTSITINPILPDTNFVASPRAVCVGDSITFSPSGGASIDTFAWNFHNGDTNVILSNLKYAYDSSGTYDVTLIVTDTNGCVGTRTRPSYIRVQDYPTSLFETNFDDASTICYPVTIIYTDTTLSNFATTRQWDLGTGGSVVPNASVGRTYNQPGAYDISLINTTSFGCSDTAEKTINVVGPVAQFDVSDNDFCVGETITFTITDSTDVEYFGWDFGDGTTGGQQSPIDHQYTSVPTGGTTVARLISYSADSACSATDSVNISVLQVEARFDFVDSSICASAELEVINNSVGNNINSWNFGNGVTSNQEDPSAVSYSSIGDFPVRLIIENTNFGCIDTLIKIATILPDPFVTAPGALDICSGDSVFVTASGADFYSWDPAVDASSPNDSATFLFPSLTTTFTVTGELANGCTGTQDVEINVLEPISDIFYDTCVVIGQEFTIGRYLGERYNYTWENSSNLDWTNCITCPVQENVSIREELDNLELILNYSDTSGCYENSIIYDLCITPSYTFDLPNAFTPDGDGINDEIFLEGHGIQELVELKIYNRWGEIVFETTDIKQGWDGFYKGQRQGMETFVFQATVIFFNGEQESKSGSFTLIR